MVTLKMLCDFIQLGEIHKSDTFYTIQAKKKKKFYIVSTLSVCRDRLVK